MTTTNEKTEGSTMTQKTTGTKLEELKTAQTALEAEITANYRAENKYRDEVVFQSETYKALDKKADEARDFQHKAEKRKDEIYTFVASKWLTDGWTSAKYKRKSGFEQITNIKPEVLAVIESQVNVKKLKQSDIEIMVDNFIYNELATYKDRFEELEGQVRKARETSWDARKECDEYEASQLKSFTDKTSELLEKKAALQKETEQVRHEIENQKWERQNSDVLTTRQLNNQAEVEKLKKVKDIIKKTCEEGKQEKFVNDLKAMFIVK